MAKNFDYLKEMASFVTLYNDCNEAETFVYSDPNKSALACRRALEWTVVLVYKVQHWDVPEHTNLFELVSKQDFKELINSLDLMKKLHFIRSVGNRAAHQNNVTKKESYYAVLDLYYFIGDVLMEMGFVEKYPKFNKDLLTEMHSTLVVVNSVETQPSDSLAEGHKPIQSLKDNSPKDLSEAATRILYINEMLREAGWHICEEKGAIVGGKACIEIELQGMPNGAGVGYADYVLFDTDGKPLAVVEAKKTTVEPVVGKQQAILYADCLENKYGIRPVIYYTNGFEVNVIDGQGYPARTIYGFHTRQDLQKIIERRGRADITDMQAKPEIIDRYYQTRAVKSVCEHFNKKFRRALLVMATGTGKTRVAIALVDVLLRNNWIKNVLFLADRTELVRQAYNNFKKLLPGETKCNLCDSADKNTDARVLFSTYQTMINYIDAEKKGFSIGRFDLIIIDEAHRSVFGKYGAIFDYFDSLLIGLTATPRDEIDRSTYRLMDLEDGEPTDSYEYEQAVKDGYLVDFKALRYHSDIINNGIKYKDRTEEEKEQLETIFEYEKEHFDLDRVVERDISEQEIFDYIYNVDTIDKVLQELMEKGIRIDSGENIGKTIIFAYNHKHADLIVKRFAALYPQYGDGYCALIDYQETYKQTLIDNFEKPASKPYIAVSVDMLDTGIDVPEAVNLVFFKIIRSKIKFWQMIGRGTRLCKNLFGPGKDKKEFYIFDWCNNFDYFDAHPQGAEAVHVKSLTERLFQMRSTISYHLQAEKYQKPELFEFGYHAELVKWLSAQITTLGNERIQVRKYGNIINKYRIEDTLKSISEDDLKNLKEVIAPLLVSSCEVLPAKLDLLVLDTEISKLMGEAPNAAVISKLTSLCKFLIKNKSTVPQVQHELSTLMRCQDINFWQNADLENLEAARKILRDLVQFAVDKGDDKTFVIDIEDIFDAPVIKSTPKPQMTYKEKVIDYLSNNKDNAVIKKIFNLEPLTLQDIHELERIFWEQLGTKQQYDEYLKSEHKYYGGRIAVFIRSLCGIDRQKARKKFSEFINSENLTSSQEQYLNSILEYVCANGDMQRKNLGEDPFINFKWSVVFGDKRTMVAKYVQYLHDVIQAPAV